MKPIDGSRTVLRCAGWFVLATALTLAGCDDGDEPEPDDVGGESDGAPPQTTGQVGGSGDESGTTGGTGTDTAAETGDGPTRETTTLAPPGTSGGDTVGTTGDEDTTGDPDTRT